MNILLWIIQVALAVLSVAGGAFKVFSYEDLAKVPSGAILPQAGWSALGVFEIVCGVLLVVPAALKWMPTLTPAAAAALAVESLILAVAFARYSQQVAVTNPMVWAAAMGLMAAFVAYGRYALRPLT